MSAELFSLFYQFADVFAFLILSAAGLAIVFGMMGVINMAHGEFIMCGAYVTVGLVNLGVPLPIAQILAALTAGLIGVAVEFLIVRRFYKRPLEFAARHLGAEPHRDAIHAPDHRLRCAGHRHARRKLRDRRLHFLDLSSGVVRLRGGGAGRSLHHFHEDALRRDCARDDAECGDGQGAWRADGSHLRDQLRNWHGPRRTLRCALCADHDV